MQHAAIIFLLFLSTIARADSPRRDQLLDDSWLFIREDAPGAEAPAFDDSAWQHISIPHTWNTIDAQSGPNYHRGPAWYRRHLTLTESDCARSNFLRFEAASVVADVFVNGKKLGQHRGAFGAFCFDASASLHPGDNIIAVRVDNSKFPDIAPLSGDFAIFGGIYRSVHLLSLHQRSIDPLDDASPGVYLLQKEITPERARIQVTTKLRNTQVSHQRNDPSWSAVVRCIVRDASGNEVAKSETTTSVPRDFLANGIRSEAVQEIVIDNPHLWCGHPTSDAPAPSLYTVTIETLDRGTVTDRIIQPLGLRSIRLDPDRGLFLNNLHYPLRGPNKHQDRRDKGWAVSHQDLAEDFNLILEMGSSGVRLAHYQHADDAYTLCDSSGLLVWAEIPLVDRVAAPQYADTFAANTKQQLRELIKQNFNHPGIVCWGIFNELWMGRDQNKDTPLPQELFALAKSLDPSRPIVCADNGPPDYPPSTVTDAVAFNRYYGWYVDKHTDWPRIDELHAKLPTRPVGISEYGAGANPAHHESDPKMPVHNGPRHPEEYQSLLHESAWKVLKSRDWLWCTFFWNMFDFATPIRQEGGFQSLNDKGVVTYDRTLKKDAFYFYRANWSTEPVVYITSRRFSPRPAGPSIIKLYSNQPAVELFINDQSRGTLHAADFPDRVFEWKNVTLPQGLCRVRAVGKDAAEKPVAEDRITWLVEPANH